METIFLHHVSLLTVTGLSQTPTQHTALAAHVGTQT